MGFLLFLIATILWIPLTFINWIIVAIKHSISNHFLETAIDIDRFGNRNFRAFLNWSMQRNGYKFGDERETISSALGKNQRDKKLTKFGKAIVFILYHIDYKKKSVGGHCIASIKELDKLK